MNPANLKASLRCAVYTRVSTEHGLEQEFNSLDNQREASEAYIKSQAHEGWRLMRERYDVPIGYSGHETGIPSTIAAVVLGACCVERHITMDRSMWGSDHAASLEPNGISRVVRDIRLIEKSMGDGVKRVYEREYPIIKKLRRVDAVGQ